MIELNITFFIQLVNFLILLAVLNLILYRPIRGVLKKRADHSSLCLQDTEKFLKLANERLAKYESEMDKARKKGLELRQGMKDEAYEAEKELLASATQNAASQLQTTKESVAQQQGDVLASLQNDIKTYAQAAAQKILTQA